MRPDDAEREFWLHWWRDGCLSLLWRVGALALAGLVAWRAWRVLSP